MVSCIASLQDSECVKLGLIILNDFYGGLLKWWCKTTGQTIYSFECLFLTKLSSSHKYRIRNGGKWGDK